MRPFVEKCITIAKKSIPHVEAAEQFATDAERNSNEWRQWRESDQWQKWNATIAPAIHARRRVFAMLRDKEAVEILFDEIAPRYLDRPGGYTRVLKLAKPRLGDAGDRAILELVGKHDRVKQKAEKPAFEMESDDAISEAPQAPASDADAATDESTADAGETSEAPSSASTESTESDE